MAVSNICLHRTLLNLHTQLFRKNVHSSSYRNLGRTDNKWFKTNSAAGFDETIKQFLGYFVKPLTHIYNVSFQTGIFPDIMKKAKIRPF
jgi:hypothetical protein